MAIESVVPTFGEAILLLLIIVLTVAFIQADRISLSIGRWSQSGGQTGEE